MEITDEEAVARARDGDAEAFGVLVRRYQGSVYRYLVSILGRKQDVEEVAQEAFLGTYRNLRDLRSPGAFRWWLFRAARNRAIDYMRRQQRPAGYSGEAMSGGHEANHSGGSPSPEERALQAEELAALVQAIRGLPTAYREVVHLKYVEEMSVREIAVCLGLSPRTVETRLYRARQRLRAALEGVSADDG